MADDSRKNNNQIAREIIIALVLAIAVFNLSVLSGFMYLIAVYTAIKNGLFMKKRKMASHLFGGTILIYCAGLLFHDFLDSILSTNILTAIAFGLLAAYFWIKGFLKRKYGIELKF